MKDMECNNREANKEVAVISERKRETTSWMITLVDTIRHWRGVKDEKKKGLGQERDVGLHGDCGIQNDTKTPGKCIRGL